MAVQLPDLTTYTDADLAALRDAVNAETERRTSTATAQMALDQTLADTLLTQQLPKGEPWRKPRGVYEAYPNGWTVTYNGKTYAATDSGVTTTPGAAGWKEMI